MTMRATMNLLGQQFRLGGVTNVLSKYSHSHSLSNAHQYHSSYGFISVQPHLQPQRHIHSHTNGSTILFSCISQCTSKASMTVISAHSSAFSSFAPCKRAASSSSVSASAALFVRSFHCSSSCRSGSASASGSTGRRHTSVSGASGIWLSAEDSEEHSHSHNKADEIDLLQWEPGKYKYLDSHIPAPPPLPTSAIVDDQLARVGAVEQEKHLLLRTIEERHRLYLAEAKRRGAEDVYNDAKNWFGGDAEPRFNVFELARDAMRMLVLGTLFSFFIHFLLLPFGKLFGFPIPNPALALILRAYHFGSSKLQQWTDSALALRAGEVLPQYEESWLDALADKVIFKMKNPGAALPLENRLFVFPVVVRAEQDENSEQIAETLQKLRQHNSHQQHEH